MRCIRPNAPIIGDSAARPLLYPATGDVRMSGAALEALDLAALLCSRVCHDLISPIGAIVNGLEVLAEERTRRPSNLR